jgi:DNA gyrase subunit B
LTFFYRHMHALVENNFIYIAQPPLYRVSRKKTSRYIHSEREMDDYLLELGLSDVQMRIPKQDRILDQKETKEMTQCILEVENFIARVERKGIPFREFLALKDDRGQLPRFQVNLTEGSRFVYSEDELIAFRNSEEESQRLRHEQTLASIPDNEITEEMKIFKPSRLHFTELYEKDFQENLQTELTRFGFTMEQYFIPDGSLVEVIEDESKKTDYHTLHEFIDFLRANGRKGIEIQRYKGLGEMNADQLWETTMDPKKRTLIKVTLPDVIAADRMFSMLMGEDVPPRRAFIEQNALSVKKLDV